MLTNTEAQFPGFARHAVEITVDFPFDPNVVHQLALLLGQSNNPVFASCWHRQGDRALYRFVAEDAAAAQAVLATAGWALRTQPVILIDLDQQLAGAARLGSHLTGAGLTIEYSYACRGPLRHFYLVLHTSANADALRLLQQVIPLPYPVAPGGFIPATVARDDARTA